MRRTFKAAFEGGFSHRSVPVAYQMQGMVEAFFQKPFTGAAAEELFEIAFEGGKAAVA
jgi:hypothetical protein